MEIIDLDKNMHNTASMFVKLLILFFTSCFAVCGQVKYLPFEGEDLKAILVMVNEIYELDRMKNSNLSNEKRQEIENKRNELRNEINTLGKRFGKGTLPLHTPEKPDLTKLPLTGWAEGELISAAEDGKSAACMELVYRWLERYHQESHWAVYSQINKWLSLAKEKKYPGAEFLWNILLTPPESRNRAESGNSYRHFPGFDEFDRVLNEGDTVFYKIIGLLHNYNIMPAREWIDAVSCRLEQKSQQGDDDARRAYVMWSLIRQYYFGAGSNSDDVLTGEKRRQWLNQLCENGDMEARRYWLMERPEICTPDYLEKMMRYAVELYNAGYISACDSSFFSEIFNVAFGVERFDQVAFPLLDRRAWDDDLYGALRARGDWGIMADFFIYYNTLEERRVFFQDKADRLIKMGSWKLFLPLLEHYHSSYQFSFFDPFFSDSSENNFVVYATIIPLAEKGHPGAMAFMAICYMHGLEVHENIQKSLDLWERTLEFYKPLEGKNAFDFRNSLFEIRVNIERCRMKQAGEDEKVKKEIAQRLQALEREAEADASGDQQFGEAGLQTLNFYWGLNHLSRYCRQLMQPYENTYEMSNR